VAQGVPGRLRPRSILTFRHYKGGRSSAKRTGRLYLRKNPWYSLSEAESTSGHMVLSGVPQKKIPSDTTRNRSRDRPTSSDTLPQAPAFVKYLRKNENAMKQFVNYFCTSRRFIIQLEGRSCIMFSCSLVFP